MTKQEQRIRELAYGIWVSEGRPHGEDTRHWEMARKLAEAENDTSDTKPARTPRAVTKPTDATPAEISAKAATAKDLKQPADVKPAKPAVAPTKGTARAKAKAGTDAAEGTPEGVKKTRAPRAKKES